VRLRAITCRLGAEAKKKADTTREALLMMNTKKYSL